jgi:hypothetical protein
MSEDDQAIASPFAFEDDLDRINALYRDRRWSDGLPIVPPTPERVQRMLAGWPGRDPHELVATLVPGFGAATLHRIAINAVLAGCGPQHFAPLVAAVQALADPAFNLQAIQATTNPVAVWVLVNGPAAAALQFNGGTNCLGEGSWGNATLGRAVRLVLRNIGGAWPGELDRTTHGQPGRYAWCCAENETDSPWPPLHVERGFAVEANTVTVIGAEGTLNLNSHSKTADELVRVFAESMIHPPSNEYTHGGEPFLIVGPEHARVFAEGGYSKATLRQALWEASRMPAGRMAGRDRQRAVISRREELGEIGNDTLLPIAPRPDGIGVVVAGGPGTHSVYVPCFGNSLAVTRAFTALERGTDAGGA